MWKKPPFVPRLMKNKLQLPKTPLLHTVIRAQERKQFDDTVKEKERLREEKRQMVKVICNFHFNNIQFLRL